MTIYVMVRNGEHTNLESTLIQVLWRLASTWNVEGDAVYTIARG